MFNFLKKKLKTWTEKAKKAVEADETPKKEKLLKTKKLKIKLKPDKKQKKQVEKSETSPEPEEQPQATEEIIKEKTSKLSFLKRKLSDEKFEELFQELELILLQNNIAIEVVEKIKLSLKEQLIGKSLSDVNLETALKKSIQQVLIDPFDIITEIKKTLEVKKPYVIVFVGINGSGKTTSIAKLANLLKKNKLSVCLAAADTFRAASIEQLQKHADNLKVPLIKKDYNTDPAAVGFDAIAYAKKHHIDVVLIDTAGRMQNKDSLMREIEKINRVNKPDMRIFVGESITGNDATQQAKAFNDAIDLTGIILSKADVDEKGGTAISVSYVTKKPILFLGTGQTYDDLIPFNQDDLIKKLGL